MSFTIRTAGADDALCIAALATQTFLDTYATEGIRPDLAREVFTLCSPAAYVAHLAEANTRFLLAQAPGGLLGFAQISLTDAPAYDTGHHGSELVRLYVQPRQKRSGVGRALMQAAQTCAREAGFAQLWLTVWNENAAARAFYSAIGFADVGAAPYVWEDQHYENRVLIRALDTAVS